MIKTDLATFEEVFVKGFPQSVARQKLFDNYCTFMLEFSAKLNASFTQWIDGSFVTTMPNPNDIDVVIFVDYRIFKERQLLFVDTNSLKQQKGLDLYFVQTYPVDHPDYFRAQFDEEEWKFLFSFNRKSQPKGFIHLNG